MLLKLPPETKIKIYHIPPTPLSPEYIRDREEIWNKELKDAKVSGKKLFNGELYTIEKIFESNGELNIFFSTCEFKDRVLKRHLSGEQIIAKYGHESLRTQIGIGGYLKTSDGYYGFGITGKTMLAGAGLLDIIGGTLNKDEQEVNNLDDLKKYIAKEFFEETNLSLADDQANLYGIAMLNSRFEFIFDVNLPMTKDEVKAKAKLTEIDGLVFLTYEELKNNSLPEDSSFSNFKKYF